MLIGYVFKYTKLVVYNIFVIAFGFLFAFLFAFLYGLTSFILSWIWSPSLRLTLLTVNAVLPVVTEPLRALFLPLVDVSARIFRQIRIKTTLDGGLLLPLHKVETRPHEA